jgi:hypothetical protein
MSCCGKSRVGAKPGNGMLPVSRPLYGTVVFEYTGHTGLTVIGPVTRTTYHFDGPGSRNSVDGRDSISLATLRTLRRV